MKTKAGTPNRRQHPPSEPKKNIITNLVDNLSNELRILTMKSLPQTTKKPHKRKDRPKKYKKTTSHVKRIK